MQENLVTHTRTQKLGVMRVSVTFSISLGHLSVYWPPSEPIARRCS